jgi:hypothetical protein
MDCTAFAVAFDGYSKGILDRPQVRYFPVLAKLLLE